jgi:non-specific serine/threonine protein kinase
VVGLAAILLLTISLAADAALTAAWGSGAPLPAPRSEVAAATFGSEIAIVGGFDADGGSSSRVDAYSPASDTWRCLPDLPTPRHGLGVAALGRTVYVIGGGTVPGLSVSGANESLALG